MRVYINSGHLSVDNGASAPLTQFADLAKVLGISADWGVHYYDDSLEVPDDQWPLVEQLLIETKMLYRVSGVHDEWQNVLTDTVRKRLRLPVAA